MIEEVAACRYTSAQHLAAQLSGAPLLLAVSLCSPHRVLEAHSACYDFLHVMVGGALAKLCVCVCTSGDASGKPLARAFSEAAA